jgi:tyrosine-protein kinase Etk/Wzc
MAQGPGEGVNGREGRANGAGEPAPRARRNHALPGGGAVEAPGPAGARPARDPVVAVPARDPTLAELAAVVSERRWTVIGAAAAAIALAVTYVVLARPVYESSVLIQVDSRTRPVAAFQDLATLFDTSSPAEGEMRIMESSTLLAAVIQKLHLDVQARPRTLPILGGAISRAYGGTGPADVPLGLSFLARFAWGGERIHVDRLEVSDSLLGDAMVVTALGDGRYRVAAQDGTPLVEGKVGAPATGAAGERSIEVVLSELTARPGTQFVLTRQRSLDVLQQLQDALVTAEQGRDTGLVQITLDGDDPAKIAAILDAVSTTYLRQSRDRTSAEAAKMLQILEAQLPVLKDNLTKAETALKRFREKNGMLNLSVEAQGTLVRLAELDRAIADHEVRSAELSERYTPGHSDVAALDQGRQQLLAQRAAVEARLRTFPELDLESTRLLRQVTVSTELYSMIVNRAEELRIVKSGWIGNARVLEQAMVPYRPVAPKGGLVLTLATLLGIAGGLATALARNALDDRVRDPDALEAGTHVPVLATIPRSAAQRKLARRKRLGPLGVAAPADPALEDLRGLRTGVQYALQRARNNVVAVASPVPRAGKSFVSVNLAHLLAASGRRVLLVDADLRRGVLHEYFGLEPQPGVSDVVRGEATLAAAVRHTAVPNLDVLLAGSRAADAADLVAGAPFQRLLEELGHHHDVVIVDTPPILSVADSALVGRHAGVNLLVVRAGAHAIGEIRYAVKRLVQSGVALQGTVLNEVRWSTRRYGGLGGYRAYERYDASH